MEYAILRHDFGDGARYTLRRLLGIGFHCPVSGNWWPDENGARIEANVHGMKLLGCGDNWEIIAMQQEGKR